MTTTLTHPDTDLADVLDRAARIIDQNGLNRERFFGDDAFAYETGMACCTVAAVGVALGHRDTMRLVAALDADFTDHLPRHPALRAIARHLGLHSMRALYEWSDNSDQDTVVAALQDCAAELRGAVTA